VQDAKTLRRKGSKDAKMQDAKVAKTQRRKDARRKGAKVLRFFFTLRHSIIHTFKHSSI